MSEATEVHTASSTTRDGRQQKGPRARVHIVQRIDPAAVADLQDRFAVSFGYGPQAVPLEQVAPEIDALVVRDQAIPNDVLDAAVRLRIIARAGIGLDGIDLAHAEDLGIRVRNTPGTNSRTVAEYVVALGLAASKGIVHWDGVARRGEAVRRDEAPVHELDRKVWGIVGYGRIGREVAAIVRDGLRMKVAVYLRPGSSARTPDGVDVVADLDQLLAESDVVSVHVPLLAETTGMIGAREIALMKPTSVLVNAARGPVVDARALIEALTERTLFAAAIDVWDGPFPLPPDPLYDTPHLVVSPHRAGRTVEADIANGQAAVREVVAVLGEGPEH